MLSSYSSISVHSFWLDKVGKPHHYDAWLKIQRRDQEPSSSSRRQRLQKNSSSPSLPPPNKELENVLKTVGLHAIKPISDLGYYGWRPPKVTFANNRCTDSREPSLSPTIATKALANVTAHDIKTFTDLNATPPVPCPEIHQITLPIVFDEMADSDNNMEIPNKFPYGQTSVASLYAAKQKGVDLSTVQYLFGSYTLYHLAYGKYDHGETSVVARVPGIKNMILVTRYKEYMTSLSTKGYQFERIVLQTDNDGSISSAGNVNDPETAHLDSVSHLQIMKIGTSKVLFAGEADAMDTKTKHPIEIKLGSMRNRAIRTLFQMISSGSCSLIQGQLHVDVNDAPRSKTFSLTSIDVQSLQEVAEKKPRAHYGQPIQERMELLRELTATRQQLPEGKVMELVFYTRNKRKQVTEKNQQITSYGLKLVPSRKISIDDLFPHENVVRELLGLEEQKGKNE